jgi:hypothetical protein
MSGDNDWILIGRINRISFIMLLLIVVTLIQLIFTNKEYILFGFIMANLIYYICYEWNSYGG